MLNRACLEYLEEFGSYDDIIVSRRLGRSMTTQKRLKTISSDLFELEEIIRSQGNVGFCLKPYIVHVRHVLVLEPVSRDHNPFRSTVKTLQIILIIPLSRRIKTMISSNQLIHHVIFSEASLFKSAVTLRRLAPQYSERNASVPGIFSLESYSRLSRHGDVPRCRNPSRAVPSRAIRALRSTIEAGSAWRKFRPAARHGSASRRRYDSENLRHARMFVRVISCSAILLVRIACSRPQSSAVFPPGRSRRARCRAVETFCGSRSATPRSMQPEDIGQRGATRPNFKKFEKRLRFEGVMAIFVNYHKRTHGLTDLFVIIRLIDLLMTTSLLRRQGDALSLNQLPLATYALWQCHTKFTAVLMPTQPQTKISLVPIRKASMASTPKHQIMEMRFRIGYCRVAGARGNLHRKEVLGSQCRFSNHLFCGGFPSKESIPNISLLPGFLAVGTGNETNPASGALAARRCPMGRCIKLVTEASEKVWGGKERDSGFIFNKIDSQKKVTKLEAKKNLKECPILLVLLLYDVLTSYY
ncbi:unnamed protein product [Nesidiocoris tenuis]|uniref:Uncharacterized protein n=1 Tax=Nesidiocoris tenuis TaxID=355587 RepID=A0A6H5GGC2_9HEMI|nr:unnamed protein product [Nesidiocoris tenuis]